MPEATPKRNLGSMNQWAMLFGLAGLCLLARLVPHPPNFTPVGAIALFAGATMSRRWVAFALPLGVMVLSDLVLGMHALAPVVYLSMLGYAVIGRTVCSRPGAGRIVLGSLLGSSLFFVVTNLGCWMRSYDLTLAGLVKCYTAAIPFFGNTLAGDLTYSAVAFGASALVLHAPRLAARRKAIA